MGYVIALERWIWEIVDIKNKAFIEYSVGPQAVRWHAGKRCSAVKWQARSGEEEGYID